jgi:choline dehydrogenase-like flavoprotein
MLSGIGDPQSLAKLHIEPTVNLPGVGRNLQDHVLFTLQWSVNSTETFDKVVFNQTAFAEAFQQYTENKTGIFAKNFIANQIGFFRLAAGSDALKHGDHSAGPSSPHYEFGFHVRCID